MKPIRAAALLVWLAGVAWPAFAQTHAYSVYVDLDNDPATGCTIVTAAGSVPGIEAVLTADVSIDPAMVTGQHLARCQSGVLGSPTAVPGNYPYPVGFDQGADGFDVIELGAPLQSFGAAMNQINWRLTFGSEGALLGGADITESALAAGLGFVPLNPTFIPATSLFALALLALALAIGTVWMARRRPQFFSILLVASALGLSGLAWAAVHLLDGGIGDWSGAPLVSDPQGDATQDEPPIDIRQAFAAQQGNQVFFRIDVQETRLSVLIPPLLDTQFSIAENSPNGTTLGPVRPSASGLSSILALSLTSQTPAAGFAFDPASAVLSVGNTALLDFETHTQFQLGFTATLAGVPGYTLPVAVNIAIEDVNETPTLAAQNFSLLENAANGSTVGTVVASDPDAGANGQLTYAITGGSGQAVFAINSASGVITVANAGALDVSASPYDLDVTVSDGGSPALTTSATMTISIVDVNDAPSFTPGGDVTVAEDSGAYDAAWATALSDGDDGSQTLTFEITANDNPALFSASPVLDIVAGVGHLRFTPAADANGVASLTVVLRDDGGTDNDGVDASAPVSFDITVTAVNDAPVLTVPGTQETDGSSAVVFSTANGNAISVADVDAGNGIIAMSFSSNGSGPLTLANPDAALTITGNGSDTITATGTLAAFNAALNGTSGSLTYTPTTTDTTARTLDIEVDDQGHSGAGGALSDTASIDIDAPPVISATPAAGLVASDVAFGLSFSEPVDVIAGAISLSCNGGANLITGGDTGTGVTTLAPVYAGTLPEGQTCVLTVLAANVRDSDGIDPPDHPVADFTRSYSVDAAPSVTATSPANAAIVPNDVALSVTFSEAVDASAGSVTLVCNGGSNLITGGDSGTGVTTLTPSYTAPLPSGNCTMTVLAAHIDDSDLADPPANPVADHVVNFTVDAAPVFVSATPAEGEAIATTGSVSFTFDEAVNDLGGAIVLDCGTAVAGTISGSGTPTLTFTPAAALAQGASCTATAVAASIGDSDDVDPPEHPSANVSRSFTVDAAPSVLSITPANGAIDVGLASNIVVTFSEPVNFTAAAFSLACPDGTPVAFTLSGDGTNTATIDPVPTTLPIDTLCTFSVDAALVSDVDTIDPPDTGDGVTSISFTTVNDHPPSVTASTPANGEITANNVALSITFSEPVDVAANAVTLTCGGANLITGGDSGSNVTSLAPSYAGTLPEGGDCVLTVLAANVTDVDTIDPPDEMLANYVVNFSIDAAPEVISVSPANGTIGVATNSTITVEFSESVDIASAAAFSLECPLGLPIGYTVTSPATLPASATSFTLTPAGNLPEATACSFRVFANAVEDTDTIDPPGNLAADFISSFTTDAAPTVTSVTPANGAVVNTSPTITVNFSEQVNLDPGVFTLDCGGNIATTPSPALPADNIGSISFTPDTALPEGANCTATVLASAVHDADSNDPPDTMLANHVWGFSVDVAPSVVSIVPVNGASNVNPTSDIVITFSEPVAFDTTPNAANSSFDLECPGGSPANFSVTTASPATGVTLNPLDSGIAGRTCVLTVRGAGISDIDGIDPPEHMAADVSVTFSVGAIANDDSVDVTPQLTVSTADGAINLTANDILGAGQITEFGFGSCGGTPAGNQLDAGAGNGRLGIAANGSFSYEPPAGVANATRTFCYTVTGGDTANVAFAIQNTELVWFVDAAAAAGGIGTQARPFNALSGAGPVQTANDTIFVASHASTYPAGITLGNGVRLIGQGSSGTLTTHSGVTPVTGSAFPALGGTAPTLSASNATAITLGSGNTLRGFNIGDTGATSGTDIAGTNFGTLNVAEVALQGTGRALNLDTGTMAGSGFTGITVTASGSEGIRLNAVAGTLALGSGAISGTAASVPALHITGAMGTLIYAGSIAKTSSGALVSIAGQGDITLTGDLDCTAACGSGAGAQALLVSKNAGSVGFTGASKNFRSSTNPNPVIQIINSGSASVMFSGATYIGAPALPVGGTGLSVSGGGLSMSGILEIATLGARAIDINGATLLGTMSGYISTNGALGANVPAIQISNSAAPAGVTFGQELVLDHDDAGESGGGIRLQSNTGTYSFPVIARITSGDTTAVWANNAGTLGIGSIQPGQAVSSGTATIEVRNTTIAASGLNFTQVNSFGGSRNGIMLENTGSAGGLVVTGSGTAGSGGTINHKTGADADALTQGSGIVLVNTAHVSLRWMQLNDFQNSGIIGRNVDGFTLQDSVIGGVIGNNTGPVEGPIVFGLPSAPLANGLQGTGLIRNVHVSGGIEHNMEFYNQSGSMALTIDGVTAVSEGANPDSPADDVADCRIDGAGVDGIQIETRGSATASITVNRCLFRNNGSQAIQASVLENSQTTVNINESFARRFTAGNEGFLLQNGGNGRLTTRITNNTLNNYGGVSIFVGQVAGNANALAGNAIGLNAIIRNNIISAPTTATNHAIIAFLTSTVGQVSRANVLIDGNTIAQASLEGTARPILVDTPDAGTTPEFTATVTNNNVTFVDPGAGASADITVRRGNGCFDIRNNSVAGPFGIRVRQAQPDVASTARLEQGGSGSSAAATVMANNHPPATVTAALGTVSVVGNSTCLEPPI